MVGFGLCKADAGSAKSPMAARPKIHKAKTTASGGERKEEMDLNKMPAYPMPEIDLNKKPTLPKPEIDLNTEPSADVDSSSTSRRPSFTDFCAFCKKDIAGADAFMYGCFQAFCSPECRNNQIALDSTKAEPPSPANNNGAQEVGCGSLSMRPSSNRRHKRRIAPEN